MDIGIGDVVELKKKYPYVTIDKARGIVKKITIGNSTLLYVRLPPKNISNVAMKSCREHLVVSLDEVEKVDKCES